jgi:hypothetical protein
MTWHRSRSITVALRADRPPEQICLFACDGCASVTYYNRGSACSCEHCGADLTHLLGEDGGAVITLQDVWDAEEAALEDLATCPPRRSRLLPRTRGWGAGPM